MSGDSHLQSPSSAAKHRRSGDDPSPNASPKRPKHRHYRSHAPDDEVEEGEIVEDERGTLANDADVSDIESGELPNNLVESGEVKDYKLLHCNKTARRDESITAGVEAPNNSNCKVSDDEAPNPLEKESDSNNEVSRRRSKSPKKGLDKKYDHERGDSKYDHERRDSYSNGRQFDELSYRKRPRSPKYERERSRSRDYARGQSYESGSKTLVDVADQSNKDTKNDRLDRYASRSRVSDDLVERESSSYSRYDDRRESPRRGKVKERNSDDSRGKEKAEVETGMDRESSYSRYGRYDSRERREVQHESRDRRDDRHESRDIRDDRNENRDTRDGRHRSRDRRDDRHRSRGRRDDRHGSRDRRDDRHGSRDRRDDRHESRDRREGRFDGRGTRLEREIYIGSTRDSYAETRDVARNRRLGKESLKDDDTHVTDKADNGRENSRARDNDRVSSRDRHNGSRNSKYDDDHHREKPHMKHSTREPHSSQENEGGKKKSIREEDEEDYQERIEQQLAKKDEDDLDKIKEESRRRRQAILEKHKQKKKEEEGVGVSSTNGIERDQKTSLDEERLEKTHVANNAVNEVLNDKQDYADAFVPDPSFNIRKSPNQNGLSVGRANNAGGLGEGTPKSERSADMFTDDIFGESPTGVRKMDKGDAPQIDKNYLHDNWDDAEGYYSYRFGEVLDGRYEIIAAHGKGVFSTVVRAKDLKPGKGDPEEVAIKIIRSNETMYKAGQDEFVILKKLAGADPEDKRHCVRFLSCFKYRNHLCLVFESLHMNLREVLKKFGRNIGLKLTAVRAYAKQLFIALKHLRNCGVLHCDIKPDNMLVNEAKNVLKLCDFGNAMFAGKNEVTPYLVSRFYRAPEIILGLPYDHPMDMWSVGCCLYELYTGKVLFPGPSNNDMLRLHMELKGPFPKKMLRKGAFVAQHFDQDLNFHAMEEDPVTKKAVNRLLLNIKPKDIGSLITGSSGEDQKMLLNFKDLLDKIFVLDPEKRLTVSQALSHPFITGK